MNIPEARPLAPADQAVAVGPSTCSTRSKQRDQDLPLQAAGVADAPQEGEETAQGSPRQCQFHRAGRRDLRDPGRQRVGQVHAHPHPFHAAAARRGDGARVRPRCRKEPGKVRPLLNRVSADPSFFRPMSAMENLLFFGRAYGMSGPEVRRPQRRDPRRGSASATSTPASRCCTFHGGNSKKWRWHGRS